MSFIDSYVNGCIPPLVNITKATSSNCCVPSPLSLSYNYNTSNIMFNNIENNTTSPKPGLTSTAIYQLQSPDSLLQGIDLTISNFVNVAAPDPTITTQLFVTNWTVTASDKNGNTLGTMSYQLTFANPVPTKDEPKIKYRVRQLTSQVSWACGIFSSYLGGRVVVNADNITNDRNILVYRDKE